MKRKRFLQYPGGSPGQHTFGRTARLKAEELNTLSYLVRKYPREALSHISFKNMRDEVDSRGGLKAMYDTTLIDECIKRGIIKLSEH